MIGTLDRRTSLFLVAFGYLVVCSFNGWAQQEGIPNYDQHKVPILRIKPKQPNLETHKDARMFRTNLRKAARKGINFAGRYALTYWGCGASCGVGAIVDLKTGAIYFPKQLDGVWASGFEENEAPFGYRKDSRLLILDGYLPGDYAGGRTTHGSHYFVWNGSRLNRIKFVPKRNGE